MSKWNVGLGIAVILAVLALGIAPAMAGSIPKGVGRTGSGWVSGWGGNGLLVTDYIEQEWYHIYVVDPETGSRQYICPGANATQDPSGSKLAYWESIGSHDFSLSIYDLLTGTSKRTGVVTYDFQTRINWGNDNKIRFTWAEGYPYNSSLGTYWEEGVTKYWTKGLAGGPHDVLDPFWTGNDILFGRKDVGIQSTNLTTGVISTVAAQPREGFPVRFASTWNGGLVYSDVMNTYINGVATFNGTHPTLDPTGQMIALSDSGGWRIAAMPTVPEPGSLLAMSTGLLGLAGFIRRRKK